MLMDTAVLKMRIKLWEVESKCDRNSHFLNQVKNKNSLNNDKNLIIIQFG